MPRVIVLDNLAQEGLDLLEAAEGIDYEIRVGLAGDELRDAITEFDGAVCRSGAKLTADVLAGNRRLKAIVRAGVGTDNIDKQMATRQGIVVMNTPTGNTVSTAEHAFALMLGMSRNVAPAYKSLCEGRWDRKLYMGAQLADKTLGVVGLGRIGREVAKRALAFEMKVIGYDPFLSPERAAEMGVEPVENVRDMLPEVDYLTVHTPLTDETRDLIGAAEIKLMKPGVRPVNCARGGIYNEKALVDGLQSGRLAGVAVDVYATEPCTDSPLFDMPGVLCTPHLGASTGEAQTNVAVQAVQLLVKFLQTGEIRHPVNSRALDPKTLESMREHLDLAYRLGRFVAQWHGSGAKKCNLSYRGEIATKDTKLATAAFCAGLIENAMDEEVNIVNSEVLLRDRGIEITEQTSRESAPYSSSMDVELVCENANYRAIATLFGEGMPRLVQLDAFPLESPLVGTLLVFEHNDVPGMIGTVGNIFGKHNVNIAQMAVGRAGDTPGGQAIGVLNLDGWPPQTAVDDVKGQKNVSGAKAIALPPAGQVPPWLQG